MPEYSKIQTAILKTISFFDVLEWPLTISEIQKNLWQEKVTFDEVKMTVIGLSDVISSSQNFYFLHGRNELVQKRKQGYIYSWSKLKSAVFLIQFLRFIPGLRLVAICNSVAIGNIKSTSDIDLLIVTAAKRLWLTRFFVTMAVHLLGMRRHGLNISNRFCLSFYLSEEELNLENILLPRDPYFAYWLATLFVIYDIGDIHKKLLSENSWLNNFLPNMVPIMPSSRFRINVSSVAKWYDSFFYDSWVEGLESRARSLQFEIMKRKEVILPSPGASVVITDKMLKFHEEDRRQFFYSEWQRRLVNLGLHEN